MALDHLGAADAEDAEPVDEAGLKLVTQRSGVGSSTVQCSGVGSSTVQCSAVVWAAASCSSSAVIVQLYAVALLITAAELCVVCSLLLLLGWIWKVWTTRRATNWSNST